MEKTIYTIGYGNKSAQELIQRLESAGVHFVADVRARPNNVARPEFAMKTLSGLVSGTPSRMRYVYEGRAFGNHHKEGPPFTALRAAVKQAVNGDFAPAYMRETPTALLCACGKALDDKGAARCHRVVIANEIAQALGMEVKHL